MPFIIQSEQVHIAAPVARVWQILTDFAAYPEWNPYTVRVECRLVVGEIITLDVQMNQRQRMIRREIIAVVEENRQLDWGAVIGAPGLLRAMRSQILKSVSAAETLYSTHDTFNGILTPFMLWLYGADMQRGFNAVAYALKVRAEK